MKKTELEFRRDGGLYKTDAKTLKDVIATAPPHERVKLEQGLGHKDPSEGPPDEAKRQAGNASRRAAFVARTAAKNNIALAERQIGQGNMVSSAKLALADAKELHEKGDHEHAAARAKDSLGYSVGIGHIDHEEARHNIDVVHSLHKEAGEAHLAAGDKEKAAEHAAAARGAWDEDKHPRDSSGKFA